MKYIRHIINYLVVILLLFFSIGSTAQNNKVKGTRITESMTESEISSNAILDLDSSDRGFMMPRMSTTQRDQLVAKLTADANEGLNTTGLVIYNTSNDCIEYWHGSSGKWRSLCGSLPPAKFDFVDGCGNIVPSSNMNVEGAGLPSWQQDRPLSSNIHTMAIRIYVSQAGTYSIHADSGNGYFFSAEGIFQAEGNYNVLLKGRGTPKVGYNQSGTGKKGDKIVFTFNGETSKKCKEGIEFKIIPAFLKLTLEKDATFTADGKYYVRSNAKESAANKLDIRFQLEVPGHVKMTAINTELGLEFMGEKMYTGEDNLNQVLTLLPVAGKSIPTKNTDNSYDLTLDVNVRELDLSTTINGAKATIVIEPTEVAIQHTTINFGTKPFYENSVLDPSSEVIVPVKVVGSGNTKMTLTNAEGVQFVSGDVVLDLSSDTTKVIPVKFKAVANDKKMPSGTTSVFTLEGTGRFAVSGDPNITFKLDSKPVGYTIDCSKGAIKSSKSTIIVDKPVGDAYYIIVPVTVTVAGEYELNSTSILNGKVSFSSTVKGKKAEFKVGDKFAYLYPTEESKLVLPEIKDINSYPIEITNNDGNSETLCKATFDVKVGWPELKVLYISHDSNYNNSQLLDLWLKKAGNFGENGSLVRTGEVSVDKYFLKRLNDQAGTSADLTQIVKDLKAQKYNFVYMEGYEVLSTMNTALQNALYDYVTKEDGSMVLIGVETTRTSAANNIFDAIYDTSEGYSYGIKLVQRLNGGAIIKGIRNNPGIERGAIIAGSKYSEEIAYKLPTIANPYIYWSEISGSQDVYNMDITGSTKFEPLVTALPNNPASTMLMKHKDYKFVFGSVINAVQDRGFFTSGYQYNSSLVIFDTYKGANNRNINPKYVANLICNMIQEVMNK